MKTGRVLISLMALFISLIASAGVYSVKDMPNVQVQDRTKHLVNPDNIISPATGAKIDSLLLDARRKSSAEVVAVIVDDIDSDDIDTYATELFNHWRIGKSDKNNGILILVAKDRHKMTIRTGYGSEGILPDIIAGEIIRNVMAPKFRNDDYDGGMLDAVTLIHRITTDPTSIEEIKSNLRDYQNEDDFDLAKFFTTLGIWSLVVTLLALLLLIYNRWSVRNKPLEEQYDTIRYGNAMLWAMLTAIGMGIPAIVYLVKRKMCDNIRNRARKCPECGARMHKLDEQADDAYLTVAGRAEENLYKSVDYDVWLCPECGTTEIFKFPDKNSRYTECPACRTYALKQVSDVIELQPRVGHEGRGVKTSVCDHCGNVVKKTYVIPAEVAAAVIPVGIGGRRSGGFGGGGSIGGGFGGGFSGGGGASGGW